MSHTRRSRLSSFALQTLAALWAAITLYPFFWLLTLSLKTPVQAFAMPPVWIFTPTVQNYTGLGAANFLGPFRNSLIIALSTVVASLGLGVPAAYGFSRARFRGRRPALWAILIIRMVPGMTYIIPFFMIYRRLGMLDTPQALIILYTLFNVALVIWTMQAFFDEVPRELEESAWVDGAGLFQAFVRILLPVSGPALVATAILCFLFSWSEFLFALVITQSVAVTAPVAITGFLAYQGADWGKIAAATILLLAPVLIFGFAMRAFLLRGLLAGAVKG
ncbi:MAG TPA: carbohydrate ABC transporter permease [bacterium]|nr:carbohydrate ABC transporter permease [bacterium]